MKDSCVDIEPRDRSFRSIFKWGRKDYFKNPSPEFFKVIEQRLGLEPLSSGGDNEIRTGNTIVKDIVKPCIAPEDVQTFENIVGRENLFYDTYSRVKYSTGKSAEEILELRQEKIPGICDLVLHPGSKREIHRIVKFCHERKIFVHVYGGGSSVTLGLCAPEGGVTLVMSTHMNRVVEFSEQNNTISVEAGMMGPDYENILNHAPEKLNAGRSYTGGHFPQSFEFSSVGGWVAAMGSGQASSYYGDVRDLVISQEYVTPAGSFKTHEFPASATGPDINEIMKGSEGCFGVLTSVTMKIFPLMPQNSKQFSFMFPDFEKAAAAARQISQSGAGMPSVMRISDPEETDIALKMFGFEQTMMDRFMKWKGLNPDSRCLMIGQTDGEKNFCLNLFRVIRKIAKKNKGLYLTGIPMRKWAKGRFSDPYMRDSLNDRGIIIDTLEASVTWENFYRLYTSVRGHIKKCPGTICMTHASHFYAQGTNLYFIFMVPYMKVDEFRKFQRSIIKKISENRGSLSHHHGIGRMMGPFMEQYLGSVQMGAVRALKNYFDPGNIMNPGCLGL